MKPVLDTDTVRRALKLSRFKRAGDLAKAINVSPAHVSSILTGRRQPSRDLLRRLAEALKLSEDKLLTSCNTESPGSHDASELAWIVERLSPEQRKLVTAYARGLRDARQTE